MKAVRLANSMCLLLLGHHRAYTVIVAANYLINQTLRAKFGISFVGGHIHPEI